MSSWLDGVFYMIGASRRPTFPTTNNSPGLSPAEEALAGDTKVSPLGRQSKIELFRVHGILHVE